MEYRNIVTDIAFESAVSVNMADSCKSEEVGCGIIKRSLHIKTKDMAERIKKPIGTYVTYDCTKSIYSSSRAAKAIESNLSGAIKSLVGLRSKASPVVVACLGNGDIASDSLGKRVFEKIEITRKKDANSAFKQSVCAISTGVLGKTGIETAELLSAVSREIKPACVLLVDSLATSVPMRIGVSFQVSTAGITPGSGVGEDKQKIDKCLLGVPVLMVGVPTLISLGTLMYGTFVDYMQATNSSLDEFKFRDTLSKKQISNMVVAPKDVDVVVENASVIISNAINLAMN